MRLEILVYIAAAFQALAWVYFNYKGGKLTDAGFYLFTAGMMVGQLAVGYESFVKEAWSAFGIQVFFFIGMAYGALQRFRLSRGYIKKRQK